MYNTIPSNPFPPSTEQIHGDDIAEIRDEVNTLKSGFTNLDTEVNGDATVYPYADVITIEDAVPSNLAECSVKIEPVQSGSGDPSPTNVRPITGHTEVTVTVTDDAESPTVTKTHTIALGDTIYGGTVDFDSGVMTVDRQYIELDTLNWSRNADWGGYPVFYSNALNNYKATAGSVLPNAICSDYKGVTRDYLNVNNVTAFCIASNSNLTIRDYRYDNAQDFTAAMDGVQLVYELATPTTIQLTPQQIQLLKGTNTLTASTGQISVTVNGISGAIGSVQEQVNDIVEDVAELAEQLPDAPTTDGAYVLTVTVADGTPTYSWESTT